MGCGCGTRKTYTVQLPDGTSKVVHSAISARQLAQRNPGAVVLGPDGKPI